MKEHQVIIGPVDTEKSNIQREEQNQVTFEVAKTANRVQIRKAVEAIFNVEVANVRTLNVKGKIKRRGRILGRRKDRKKAMVTLMSGSRIKFFEGV